MAGKKSAHSLAAIILFIVIMVLLGCSSGGGNENNNPNNPDYTDGAPETTDNPEDSDVIEDPEDSDVIEDPEDSDVIDNAPEPTEDFSIIVLPDTQNYAAYHPEYFDAQTQWIASQKDALNIVMVLHEGDLVGDDENEQQWQNAHDSMSVLDNAAIPYAIVPGNHDYSSGSRNLTDYNYWFPVSRFQEMSTFGGVFEPGKMDNSYHLFLAGGIDFLVLALEFGPRDTVLDWANQLVRNYPEHRIIVLTHAYLNGTGTRLTGTDGHNPHFYGHGNANDGQEMWDKFIKLHDTIDFVLCGHDGGPDDQDRDPAFNLVSNSDLGNPVCQIIANYQYCPVSTKNDGNLRIMTFSPTEKKVSVYTYSPVYDAYKTEVRSQFEITGLDFF